MTDSLARRLMRDLLGPPVTAGAELVVEGGPALGQRLTLPGPGSQVVIGRGDGAGWIVLDLDLSRAHAVVDHRTDGAWLVDLDSKNGTRLDGVAAPIEPPGLQIHDGALITLGKTTIRYREPGSRAGAPDAATRTVSQAGPRAIAVPPRWPIVVAAAVALASIATLAVLLAS